MRLKNVLLIASLLAVSACDDGDTNGTPVDAMVVDAAGQGGEGGVGAQGGEGGGGAGGVGAQGGEGGGGDGGDGGMGGGGDGGDGGDGGEGGGGEGGDGGVGGMPPMPACSDTLDNDEDGLVDADDPGCDGPEDDDETDPPILCANGVDDDDDGLIDLEDPGCADGADFTEDDPAERPACANDADDDEDGSTDFPADVGCQAAGDDDETDEATPRACSNEADDDEDGLTDYPLDPGCAGPGDNDETDPAGLPACGNGVDDDGDGATDYPDDNGCAAAGDYDEALVCAGNAHEIFDLNAAIAADGYIDGTTVDAQATEQGSCGGMAGGEQMFLYQVTEPIARVTFTTIFEETATPTVIYVRRACAGAEDLICNRGSSEVPGTTGVIERPEPGLYYVIVDTSSRQLGEGAFRLSATEEALPLCDDALDNDEDGLIDFPNDPGCESAEDNDEVSPDPLPACADGIDNDADELIDFPDDPDCDAAFDDSENRVGCDENPNMIVLDNVSGSFNVNLAANPAGYSANCVFSETGPEQVFLVRVRQPSALRVETLPAADGSTFDTVLHMRANVCDMGAEVACDDDGGGPGFLSLITVPNLDPGDYYVFADTLSAGAGAGGPITVQIDLIPLGAACEDGQDNDADGLVDGEDPGCASPDDEDEADPDVPVEAACSNDVDDDDDGLIDFLDPGCTGVADDDEADPDPAAECANGIDDDEDMLIDFPADPGCASPGDLSEANGLRAAACSDGVDNDDDGLVDAEDPGCAGPGDLNEVDPVPAAACANGIDDDADMLIDFPRDPGCVTPGDLSEVDADVPPLCADGLDNDEDGLIDFPAEPGCFAAADDDETDPDPAPECGNGEDDDEDGLVDFPADPGCAFAADDDEVNPAVCANGLDDDDDGVIDLEDPGCFGALDNDEADGDVAACSNGEDDDEDGAIDFPDDAQCQGAGDPREDAICGDIDLPTIHVGQAGGQVRFVPLPGGDTVEGGCIFGSEGNETLIVLTLERTSTVRATFAGTSVARWLRTTCDDAESELACESGFSNDPLELFRVGPGEYYFFVETDNGGVPGPVTANFDVEPFVQACVDGEDNDGDGLVDFNDPGCVNADDLDETDPLIVPVCSDGIDNDDDGETDLADPDCTYAGGRSEVAVCVGVNVPIIDVDSAGGAFDFILEDGEGEVDGSCDAELSKEQAFAITLDQTAHLDVQVETGVGAAAVVLFLRSDCSDAQSEVACVPNSPLRGHLSARDLPAGTYYLFVERSEFADVTILTANISVQNVVSECNDEVDNDEDELTDLADPGCQFGNDDSELDPDVVPVCSNGVDDDEDGDIDFPEDIGCSGAGDIGESVACEVTEDVVEVIVDIDAGPLVLDFDTGNRDGLFNASCGSASGSAEQVYALVVTTPVTGSIEITAASADTTLHMRSTCDDRSTELFCNDDGGVGLLSRLNLVGLSPGVYFVFADGYAKREGGPGQIVFDLSAADPACGDGVDNDNDGLTDEDDPGCDGPEDIDEFNEPLPQCSNRVDDDEDTLIDENDPGCDGPDDDDEFNEPLPHCSNRLDDDDDGLIDADDPGCEGPDDETEFVPPVCGDGNIELNENCDDGNLENGDGCDDACQHEAEPDDGAIRLKDGLASNHGRLELFIDGEWGTVCDDLWSGEQGFLNADVACQQLGYEGAIEIVAGLDGDASLPIHRDDVECIGDEERLADCAFFNGFCTHSEDIGLRCRLPGECRIDADCVEEGDSCLVDNVCGIAPPACRNGFDDDEDGLIDAEDIGCDGPDDDDEATIPACGDSVVQGAENCDDGNLDAGDGCDAECQPEAEPEDGAVRLKDGPAPFFGRLEVFTAGEWGTVCDDLWFGDQAFLNADVACRQLGYLGAYAVIDGLDGAEPTPIHLDDVECTGDEERLIDCPINNGFCTHSEDIGLRCLVDDQCRVDEHCEAPAACVQGMCELPVP